jgi:hypothetical protein
VHDAVDPLVVKCKRRSPGDLESRNRHLVCPPLVLSGYA